VLGISWRDMGFGASGVGGNFVEKVVTPVRRLAGKTIDTWGILGGVFGPGHVSEKIEKYYREFLFGDKTLQDLPDDPPRFVINATNVQSGALWRFMKPYMRDYLVGEVKDPDVQLAVAVAASSAFPPVLSPVDLEVKDGDYTPNSGKELQKEPYTTEVMLTDGGVYDNLGLETAWKRYDTILVSDAGGKMKPEPEPHRDWARHTLRILDVIDNQVRSLRKQQVVGSFIDGVRKGTYWGIRTDIADYQLPTCIQCSFERTTALANTPTRLARLEPNLQERLINWGYAVCDAAMRRHVDPAAGIPAGFPYPGAGV
jgi:NTE family protein